MLWVYLKSLTISVNCVFGPDWAAHFAKVLQRLKDIIFRVGLKKGGVKNRDNL